MTKQEYKALRSEYRRRCKPLFRIYQLRSSNEFYTSDKTIKLHGEFLFNLKKFARLTGCTDKQAADVLNIEY